MVENYGEKVFRTKSAFKNVRDKTFFFLEKTEILLILFLPFGDQAPVKRR